MTYSSQKLSEALQELVKQADIPGYYSQGSITSPIEDGNVSFPNAVAEFLHRTSRYSEETRQVSIGIY